MTYEELQQRAMEARSKQDENYWEGWMADIEWGEFIAGLAVLHDWDGQIKEMMKQGYLIDHPMYYLYCPEAMLEGRAT
jgi:hypothetical protein